MEQDDVNKTPVYMQTKTLEYINNKSGGGKIDNQDTGMHVQNVNCEDQDAYVHVEQVLVEDQDTRISLQHIRRFRHSYKCSTHQKFKTLVYVFNTFQEPKTCLHVQHVKVEEKDTP